MNSHEEIDTAQEPQVTGRKPWTTPRVIEAEIYASTNGGPFFGPESISGIGTLS